MLVGAGLVVAAALLATAAPSIPMLAIVRGSRASASRRSSWPTIPTCSTSRRPSGEVGRSASMASPGSSRPRSRRFIGEAIVRKLGFRPLFGLAAGAGPGGDRVRVAVAGRTARRVAAPDRLVLGARRGSTSSATDTWR